MSDASKLARTREYQRVIASFTRTAGESIPRGELLHHAAATVAGVTGVEKTKILRYRRSTGDLLIEAGVGWKPGVIGVATLSIDERSPPGRALQTGTPVVISDLPNDPEYAYTPLLREHNVVSLFNVPIHQDGNIWGVFEVDSEAAKSFDDIDVGFLTIYANIVGIALCRLAAEEKNTSTVGDIARIHEYHQTVLRELNHRTRNNFQLIISFLSLQRSGGSVEVRDKLSKAIGRVQAVGLAQDQLSLDQKGDVVFDDYLRALCANIDPQRGIKIIVEVPKIKMPVNKAVPAGLIVNELVTNALKYAFAADHGLITVSFELHRERGEAILSVADNGHGMSEGRSGGIGLSLVDAFAGQIGGRTTIETSAAGTCVQVMFPLPMASEA